MALNIYLIRHGKTQWNLEGRLQGLTDTALVEEGVNGAKQVGEALKGVDFSACYSSMLKRAQDTANYIIAGRNIPHFHHSGLNELNFGAWEGKKADSLRKQKEYHYMKNKPLKYKAESNGGETYAQLHDRVMRTFNQIIDSHKDGENILIVAHGLTLTLLTAVLRGLPWYECRNRDKHDFVINTAINRVCVENGKAELVSFNNVEHLA